MKETTCACPICELSELRPETYAEEIEHNGKALVVSGLERYRCNHCGADPVMRDQIRRNQILICDARRQADGLLGAARIRSIREALGLSQAKAATIFGGGANAFSKYERGEVIQSLSMDRLLRCAERFAGLADFLEHVANGKETGLVDIRANNPVAPTWSGWRSDVPARQSFGKTERFTIFVPDASAANRSSYHRVEEVACA